MKKLTLIVSILISGCAGMQQNRDMQKIVDANEKLIKKLKDDEIHGE